MSAALFLPSQASADDISLNLKNVTVKRAIAALQQSHYSLTVDASQIDMERRITVAAEDEPIENVLAQIFAGQDVSYEINGRSIVVTRRAVPRVAEKAVSRTLSGVVRDDKGATIVGATVVVKGTTTGVTTDIDGRYSLRVSADNPVLQISFVGYRTAEVAVAPAQTVVDVTLAASSIDVDEVVVVGYGTQSRHTLTTAVSKIAGSAVAAAPVTSVGDALKGKVAGMQVSTTNSAAGRGADVPHPRRFVDQPEQCADRHRRRDHACHERHQPQRHRVDRGAERRCGGRHLRLAGVERRDSDHHQERYGGQGAGDRLRGADRLGVAFAQMGFHECRGVPVVRASGDRRVVQRRVGAHVGYGAGTATATARSIPRASWATARRFPQAGGA